MNIVNTLKIGVTVALISLSVQSFAKKKPKGYKFKVIVDLPTTSVKDQHASGTCWAYAGVSFLESELLRMNKGEYDLSEMFIVKKAYHAKAEHFVRYHAKIAFSGGGESNDVMDVVRKYGLMTEESFTGLHYGEKDHRHGEMDAVLEAMAKAVVKNKNRKLSTAWQTAIDACLDVYLGKDVKSFSYDETEYTPKEFQKELAINPDDYVELTSWSHHPFYSKFVMEVPDNWAQGEVYNIPLDEFMDIMNKGLKDGYSILWGSDVSEKGFSSKNGVAINPETEIENMSDSEISKWEDMSRSEKYNKLYSFDAPVKEKTVSQESRQADFDNYLTQDDHGMHITGMVKDQNGTIYYKVKNSWGDYNKYHGYFYASESYTRAKTMTYMIHKDALSTELKNKLGIK